MYLKSIFKSGAAALALGLIGLAATPAAHAADYSSNLIVQLTLDSVSGGTLGSSVTASFSNWVNGTPVADAFGGASASYDPYLYTGTTYLEHDQNVTGSAWNGRAYSELLTNGLVQLTNNSGSDVTFNFSWSIQGSANVNGPGYADAFGSAEILDANYELAPISYQMSVMTGVLESDSIYQSGTFSLTLANLASNDVSVLVNNNGNAVMAVPEPESYALMLAGLGLIGFMVRHRKA